MEKQSAQQQFEQLLKKSDFFNDSMKTAQRAAGYAVGQILAKLLSGKETQEAIEFRATVRKEFQEETHLEEGFDSSRRLILEAVAEGMDSVMSPPVRLQQLRRQIQRQSSCADGDTTG